ncbi:hypothetical protein [uncultured Brevibacillus sp.]|uniref:hypothetical protein n=1 Tax=uncultured Brevibacillus sp. TaxID=169970 RepID=UPI00259A292F|nr:hypothetical protein [uncultured Brevibacillus sp.]
MKVSELISKLQNLQQDVSIKVVIPIEGRAYGDFLKEVSEISETFDQNTNKLFYTIQLAGDEVE